MTWLKNNLLGQLLVIIVLPQSNRLDILRHTVCAGGDNNYQLFSQTGRK